MIEVRVKELETIVNKYNCILDQINENNTNLFGCFTDISKYWNDDRKINLYTSYKLEKNRIIKLTDNIKEVKEVYEYLYNEYSTFGEVIKCNLDSKDNIIYKLDKIINQIQNLIYQYDNLGDISSYYNSHKIYTQKSKLLDILDTYKTIKSKITADYDSIKEIETEAQDKLNKISIETFNLNKYEGNE